MYSDVRADRGMRWSEASGGEVWRSPNDHTNGNTLDREGRVLHCEHDNRRVARTELDGTRARPGRYATQGKRLNSPNDIVVKSDGTIWFTDPPYGIVLPDEGTPAPQEQAGCFVFRFDPGTGELSRRHRRDHPSQRPGLLARRVAAVRERHERRPRPEGQPPHRRPRRRGRAPPGATHVCFKVMEPGLADGLRVDEHGNVWSSADDGIHVISPDGADLARVRVPEITVQLRLRGSRRTAAVHHRQLVALRHRDARSPAPASPPGCCARPSTPAGGSHD